MENIQDLLKEALSLHQLKQWGLAEVAYLKVLRYQPNHTAVLVNLGAVYRQLNQPNNALSCLKKSVEIAPDSAEAWFNYGNLCNSLKTLSDAEHCFLRAIELQPGLLQARYQLAVCYREKSQWQSSIEQLQKVIDAEPAHANALLETGNCWQHLGNRQNAFNAYLTLVESHPDFWKGHYSLARWYDVDKNKKLCNKHISLAIDVGASAWTVHHSLAQSRMDIGRYQDAYDQFQVALNAEPDNPHSQIGMGACLMHLERPEEAKKSFEAVSRHDDVSVLSELARIIWVYKFFEEGISVLQKMVNLRPELPDTHLNLAKAYLNNWNMSRARESLNKALKIQPDYEQAEDLQADLYNRLGKSNDCLSVYKTIIERDGPFSSRVSSYLFSELYSDQVSAAEKFEHHKTMTQPWCETKINHHFTNSLVVERPLKVGFVSGDFRDNHPVSIFIQAVFQHYTKKRFDFSAYYTCRTFDESTSIIKNQVDNWVDAASWSDERLRMRIIEDQIDILIDLSGHTNKHRLQMFALRCAPVQVTWLGYPHSTGLAEMDYLIADKVVCPPENDHLCSEKVLRLDSHSVFCFPKTNEFMEPKAVLDSDNRPIVFGSFNSLTKNNPSILRLWCQLLESVPNSQLKMKTPSFTDAQCRNEHIEYFVDKGIRRDRLIFTGPSSLEQMMAEYNQVDIALDTFPYNGGTTSFQALWMGVPVLTLAGDNFCGRMGASVMSHLHLDDWIAEDVASFIRIAKDKAHNRAELWDLKGNLRDRMKQSVLCDTQGFCTDFEALLKDAWHNYCKSATDQAIQVSTISPTLN